MPKTITIYEKNFKKADGTKFPKLKCSYQVPTGERVVFDFILPSNNGKTQKDRFTKEMIVKELKYPVSVEINSSDDYMIIKNKKKNANGESFDVTNFVLLNWSNMQQVEFENKKTTLDDFDVENLF